MATYSDSKYGLRRRVIMDEEDDMSASGVSKGCVSVARKSKIIKFGIIPNDADVISTTTTAITLETDAGTDLGTWTPGAGTLGTGTASGKTITATTVAAGKVLRANITVEGDSGSVNHFIDIEEQFDAALDG